MCAIWVAALQNLYLELLGCIGDISSLADIDASLNNALMHQLYLSLMNFTPSIIARLDSKQLVSEFSQDALSNKTR